MRPDTSHWRDSDRYDFYDSLSVEGLAWECLRRSEPYQEHFAELAAMNAETNPYTDDAQHLWGLRFPGATEPLHAPATGHLVAARQSCRSAHRHRAVVPAVAASARAC
ncbi:transcriptional regulator domain-containing protein [Paracoccus pantotrophus]|uniref:transcriptional regulator domain-containing protein n=1 Tax=Paracoccus pantotrophus TaxID=82367 RepID=UPI0039BF0DB7